MVEHYLLYQLCKCVEMFVCEVRVVAVEFSKCMKCYGCREACPLCFCDDCCLEAEGPEWVPGGYTPAAPFFHLTRMVHMVDSCTNCGQCTEVCPCEIPVAKVWSTVNNKIRDVYGYLPGFDNGEPIPVSYTHLTLPTKA